MKHNTPTIVVYTHGIFYEPSMDSPRDSNVIGIILNLGRLLFYRWNIAKKKEKISGKENILFVIKDRAKFGIAP